MKLCFIRKSQLMIGNFHMAHLNIKEVNELDGILSLT